MRKVTRKLPQRYHQLWDHAKAGNILVIIPCKECGDVLKVGKRFIDKHLVGWIGYGSGDPGDEKFVVATLQSTEDTTATTFINSISAELTLPAILAKGFELSICDPVVRDGATKAVVRTLAGLKTKCEQTSHGLSISFEEPEPDPAPTKRQWIARLEAAYAEIQKYKRFEFEGC